MKKRGKKHIICLTNTLSRGIGRGVCSILKHQTIGLKKKTKKKKRKVYDPKPSRTESD